MAEQGLIDAEQGGAGVAFLKDIIDLDVEKRISEIIAKFLY